MAVEFKDYYAVLGVAPTATSDEIKKAFRGLARTYHPDVAKDKKAAEEKFKEINEANEVLSNPESRRKFDQVKAEWKSDEEARASGRYSRQSAPVDESDDDDVQFGGTGFSDFFEQFFGGRAGHASSGGRGEPMGAGFGGGPVRAARRGQDVQGDILITLQEVLNGGMRAISVRRANARSGGEETTTYQVRVPRGVQSGQSIRVSGKGGEGTNGGGAGDILLRVRYAEHPDWRVDGADVIGQLELTPWEAVLGATVPVSTLEGHLSVKVPPGFQQGQKLRLRGKGLPNGADGHGDLYLEASIPVPSGSTAEETRLWKELSTTSTFNPRTAR